jgi:hypothetical protein
MVGNVAIRNHQCATIACAFVMNSVPTEKAIVFSACLPGISSHCREPGLHKGSATHW